MRIQKRAIPPGILNVLFDYGYYEHDGRGEEIVCFSRKVKASLQFNDSFVLRVASIATKTSTPSLLIEQ